jgi:hypothetical protein
LTQPCNTRLLLLLLSHPQNSPLCVGVRGLGGKQWHQSSSWDMWQ